MTYAEYIAYHKRGDAGVEERMIASLARRLRLTEWDAFRLIYFYAMTYHIPSALDMLRGERNIKKLKFRTDRRYVRCNGAYGEMLARLDGNMYYRLDAVDTTQRAYDEVRKWYFFGRYAAFMFLEVYVNTFKPKWTDNVMFGWEPDENYTKGAELITGSADLATLNRFLENAKRDTQDNAFAIETSLCAVAKFAKGTRWDGYYAERMLSDAAGTRWADLIYSLAK